MKTLTLLLVLMMTPGLGGEIGIFFDQAAAADATREELGARPMYEYGVEHWTNALDEKNHGNEKKLLPAGPINAVEGKRLKLIFLLMMSLGPYRAPVHSATEK